MAYCFCKKISDNSFIYVFIFIYIFHFYVTNAFIFSFQKLDMTYFGVIFFLFILLIFYKVWKKFWPIFLSLVFQSYIIFSFHFPTFKYTVFRLLLFYRSLKLFPWCLFSILAFLFEYHYCDVFKCSYHFFFSTQYAVMFIQ